MTTKVSSKSKVFLKEREQNVIKAVIAAGKEMRKDLENSQFVNPIPSKELSLLQQADQLINGDRQKDYGDKLQNFSQISMLWQGTLATKLAPGQFITAEDVALCMIQVKVARLAKNPDHKDSILDVAGYAGCYDKLQEERAANTKLHGTTQDYREGEYPMK